MLISTDNTTLASDRWKAPAPVVQNSSDLTTGGGRQMVLLDFDPPGIMCIDSDEKLFDVFFRPDSGLQKAVRPSRIMPLELSGSGSFAYTGKYPRLFTFTGDGDQEEFSWPYGATHLEIEKPFIQGGTPSYRLKVFQPYLWNEIDFAEMLFAWTRFHTGGGAAAAAELDFDSLKAYSELVLSLRYRQRYTIWREIDRSIADQVNDLVRQSSAILSFGKHEASGLSFKLRVQDFSQLKENSAVYESDVGRDSFIVKRPIVRAADGHVSNRSSFQFGRGQNLLDVNRRDLYGATFQSPIQGPEEETTIRQEIADSVSSIGLQARDLGPRIYTNSAQYAEGAFELLRWSVLRREIEFAMGPLHFDFNTSDIIHLKDLILGLAGTEDFIVTQKIYNWDLLTATVNALEIDRSLSIAIDPDEVTSGPTLVAWFKGDAGITPGVPPAIATWANQAPGGTNLVAPTIGAALPASQIASYRNGKNVVSLRPSAYQPRALSWPVTTGEGSWTFFFCGQFYQNALATVQRIIDSTGGASGAFGIKSTNTTDGKFAFYDGADGKGPAIASGSVGILIVQLFRTLGNYVLAGDERSTIEFVDFSDGSFVCADDPQTVRANETALTSSFGDDAVRSSGTNVKLRGFAGNTALGCGNAFNTDPADCYIFEWAAFRHDKGNRPLRTSEIRGIVQRLRENWE